VDQTAIVRNLSAWLRATLWHPSLTVLYDLTIWGVRGESKRGAFYMGQKERGRGRLAQVAQADILVRRDDIRTVASLVWRGG
jgi:hypothetical protein